MRKLYLIALAMIFVLTATSALASEYTGDAVTAKLASEEIEGDFMTVWANNFSDHMKEWSDGKINIEVYPYGTLGATGDINELCQLGVVQFVFSDYAWISSFVPQAQVLALNYLFPTEKVPEILDWMVRNGKFFPLLEKKFRDNDLVPLGIMFEGWQWMTSKKEIKTMDDVKGLKLRLMSSKLLVEDYKAYGASPTPMSYGEVYSGLQMGLIDAQVNPLFADYSMKFYEVQDYFTQLKNEPFIGIPTVNAEWFDSLTPEAQAEMRKFWADSIIPAGKWIMERNAADMEKIKEARPEVQFTTLEGEALAEFKAAAQTVYPKFVEIGGDGAQEVLDALLADVENAKAALGMK
ncbi:TRAP transporter substrate-binding protein DctP [Oceanidesulfovibrio marinus]|uniref:C4-dicarboxylate ABC transporter substrate-binding protein n=1 Tax=Oceanidesulfovibrio marinus TaxID=370038 RepID=A0A6P1ZK02_9BACT|nr:TRAP transporter substrate-binding protein DctP [Oceanidesulfovibrio marinus]QJT09969.1 C4-dicarboxylate ABC transporter substrate-binding protein [Oceanidesulfovibrio marinus]TVM35913.1 C4-dicarboxylate ABC transporter substrate-binding protein [Oceanidesulfovibrio marinus]